MLSNRELWELIHQKLNVSPAVISGYTEPDAPAEPELASFSDK